MQAAIPQAKQVVIVGGIASGKTVLAQRYVAATFTTDYQQTFGADLYIKSSTSNNVPSLRIWACGGHERFRVLLGQFYTEASVALLCFDTLNPSSFDELPFWYNEVKRCLLVTRNAPDALIYVVGTKSDEAHATAVHIPDAIKLAKEWGVEYKSVSAKDNFGVDELFDDIYSKMAV